MLLIHFILTPTISVAEVGETPHVAYTNGVTQTRQYKLCLAAPLPTARIFLGALATAGRSPSLQQCAWSNSLSVFQEGEEKYKLQ
jgi:hypothetical protein